MTFLINGYTKESGVRNLERVLRRLVTKVITSKKENYTITNTDIIKYLDEPKEDKWVSEVESSGIVNALAYTSLGGATLKVECSIYNGEEKIIITGSPGDVLKESTYVAISYLKEKGYVSNTEFYNLVIILLIYQKRNQRTTKVFSIICHRNSSDNLLSV